MELQKRNCDIDFNVEVLGERWQTISLTINGDKHEHLVSVAISDTLGDLVDIMFSLFIESNDGFQNRKVQCVYDNEERSPITGLTAELDWDNEGEVMTWRFSRRLYTEEKMLHLEVDYDFGEKVFSYTVPFFDMCYAVARAVTAVLKKTGIIGYRYISEYDRINIDHFLYIKHLGIFRKHISYYQMTGGDIGDYVTSLTDEIDLLQFDM